jgi:hypothetical protein
MIGPLHDTEDGDGARESKDQVLVGRLANQAIMAEDQISASGIDAALASFSLAGSTTGVVAGGGSLSVAAAGASNPVKSAKALYNEFETMMLPQLKKDYPGLRLSQYKEKVWALWKKSPDNPANQVVASS